MFRLTAILLALSLLTTSVAAQKWIGFGGVSCGSWSEKRRTEPEVSAAYTVWVLGFVSGANVDQTILLGHPDFLKNTDKDGLRVASSGHSNDCYAQAHGSLAR
jgi:hypothetical protein